MKRNLIFAGILVLMVLLDPLQILAQSRIEISPYGGYMFGGKLRFYEGDLKIDDNVNYGLAMDFAVATDTKIEISWSQMSTTARFKPYFGYDYLNADPFDVNVGYIQVGSIRELDLDNNIVPYGGMTLGAAYFAPQNSVYSDSWKFAAGLGLGTKIWITDKVGLRLQGRLLLPFFWAGAGFTVGTGGSGFSVGAGTSMLQGDFTGGLVIGLGD